MRHIGAGLGLLTLLGAARVAPVAAQVCAGLPSLRERPFRVTASAASYTYATALGVSLTAGRAIYGTLGFGRTRDSELDANTYPLSLEIGADIPVGAHGVFLCPVVSGAVSFGPDDFELMQESFRYEDWAVGLGLAAVVMRARRISVLVAGSVRAALLTGTYWPTGYKAADGDPGSSQTGNYWLASLSVGIELNQTVTLRPGVTVPFQVTYPADAWFASPFGRKPEEISLGVAVSIGLGRRSRAVK